MFYSICPIEVIVSINGPRIRIYFSTYYILISSIRWQKPQQARLLNGYKLHSSPLPGSGVLLESIVKIFEQLDENKKAVDNLPLGLIESFKFAYAHGAKLGDTFKSPYKSEMEKVSCIFKRNMLFIRFISYILI